MLLMTEILEEVLHRDKILFTQSDDGFGNHYFSYKHNKQYRMVYIGDESVTVSDYRMVRGAMYDLAGIKEHHYNLCDPNYDPCRHIHDILYGPTDCPEPLTFTDIFNVGARALVNPVNCVGVMGKGLALEFKKRFPKNFDYYKAACDAKELQIGQILTYTTGLEYPEYIMNFPTKQHWRGKSKIEYIEDGLRALFTEIVTHKIKSVAIPKLGCGLGGLDWDAVRPLIHEFAVTAPCVVYTNED